MGLIADLIREKRTLEQGRSISNAIGSPGQETLIGPEPGGPDALVSDLSTGPTGLRARFAGDDQGLQAAIAQLRIESGDIDGGIGAFETAIRDRIKLAEDQRQFGITSDINSSNIDIDNATDAANLVIAQRKMQMSIAQETDTAKLRTANLLIKQDEVAHLEDDRAREEATLELAQLKFERLRPVDQATMLRFTADMRDVETMMNVYDENIAINSATKLLGDPQLAWILNTDPVGAKGLNEKLFWRLETDYQSRLLQARSGATVNENEFARLRPLFITSTDDDLTIRDKMIRRRGIQGEDRESFRNALTDDSFRDIGPTQEFLPGPNVRFGVPESQVSNIEERPDPRFDN